MVVKISLGVVHQETTLDGFSTPAVRSRSKAKCVLYATRCKIEHIHVAEVGVRCASRHRLYDMLSHARLG